MHPDYPAAHSMDTTWFAVDAAGRVAAFSTGENGHAPDNVEGDGFYELETALSPPAEADWGGYEESCERMGVYFYDYDEEFDPIAPYSRKVVPPSPIHIDQLPPAVRNLAVRFDRLRFDESPHVQPLEFSPCVYWYDDRVAYLCADMKTVRPIPGQEARFADFVRDFRTQSPEIASGLVFEAPPPQP